LNSPEVCQEPREMRNTKTNIWGNPTQSKGTCGSTEAFSGRGHFDRSCPIFGLTGVVLCYAALRACLDRFCPLFRKEARDFQNGGWKTLERKSKSTLWGMCSWVSSVPPGGTEGDM